jgi:CubicO group peptidase (beta-lactamase class C family)
MRRFDLLLFVMALALIAYGQSPVSLQSHRGPTRDFLAKTPKGILPPDHYWEKLNTTSTLDSFFTATMATNHIPGLAACIVKKDSILWQGYYGYADISKNTPVTDSTIFMLASISKTIMVTALMQLHEHGKFHLDDSINAYLPFQVRNPTFPGIPITFQMLLTHTSSIQDNWNAMPGQLGDYPMSLATYLQKYFTPGEEYYDPGLNFYAYSPGSIWNYSNIGAALAGYLVEVISGVPFDKYCRDSVFAPLQMSNTAWFLRDLDTTLVARPYTYSNGTYVDNGLYGYPDYPDGQLRTTAASLAKFLMANMNGGELKGSRILDSSTVHMTRTVFVPTVFLGFLSYQWGLIWYKEKWSGHDLWGHEGGDPGVTTSMRLSESDTIGVIFLSNADAGLWWTTIVSRLIDEAHTLTVGVHDAIANVPERFQLLQNYPNPFNPSTTIKFELPHASRVNLKVFNTLGQEVATLVNETKAAGTYTVEFDARSLASGVYFYRLETGSFVQTKKLVLLK